MLLAHEVGLGGGGSWKLHEIFDNVYRLQIKELLNTLTPEDSTRVFYGRATLGSPAVGALKDRKNRDEVRARACPNRS